jgi:hypothetical protein
MSETAALMAPTDMDSTSDPMAAFEDTGDVMGEDLGVGFGSGGDGTEQPM